ncbi:MAG: dihydrofolate reductase [Clostridia bacterium]|nr:dihydrofolate reductase [Clostridia bacterium]
MKLVVAVDKDWGIGYKGGLLASVRADLAHFKELTMGKTVILGSKTLATFPGGKPLKGRTNVILSRRADFSPEGAVVVHSFEELLTYVQTHPEEDFLVIGGSSVYNLLLPYCDTAYVTVFDKRFARKDAYFTNLDTDRHWRCVSVGERQYSTKETDSEDGIPFYFTEYRRVKF